MKSIMTINGGSSSIKFALYQIGDALERRLYGKIDRVGLSGTRLSFNDTAREHPEDQSLAVPAHVSAVVVPT